MIFGFLLVQLHIYISPLQALDAILEGLADEHVQTGHRLALEQRAEKILNATSNKKLAKRRKEEFNLHPLTVKDLPSVSHMCVLSH